MLLDSENDNLKFASLCVPHVGGTFTVARNLREGLKDYGISVCWIGVGRQGLDAWNDPAMFKEREFGQVVAPESKDLGEQARSLTRHFEAGRIDGVFIDVLSGILQANVARYLPEKIVRILIVHNITIGTYAFARGVRDHVHASVGVSPRIRDDLVRRHGFPEDRTIAIPNAVDLSAYSDLEASAESRALRVIFLGRVEEDSKGVFWIPWILRAARVGNIQLTVAGDGPDLSALKDRLREFRDRVEFLGRVNPQHVPSLLSRHDVLLMPSRYEGFGLTLVEAMAAGCVPVASGIRGVTDSIVEDGRTGYLFRIGDTRAAGEAIRRLAKDRVLLTQMSVAAKRSVSDRFSLKRNASAYVTLIRSILRHPPSIRAPLSLDRWEIPIEMRTNWRAKLPKGIKRALRVWRERVAL